MPFQLRVSFTGLCLFAIREDCKQVAVLQPDCRDGGRLNPMHADGEEGVHHAAYLRFDLANLTRGSKAPNPVENPIGEGVRRFRREILHFGLSELSGFEAEIKTGLPAMERIAPATAPEGEQEKECGTGEESQLQLVDGLFGSDPPLAMRTILSGGVLRKSSGKADWEFSTVFPPAGGYGGEFADEVTWTRMVEDDKLTLSLTKFGETTSYWSLTLFPTDTDQGSMLVLKVANLCSDNPLEWDDYPAPDPTDEDVDFKWMYQLFQPVAGGEIQFPDGRMPIPARVDGGAGVENCIGLRTTVAKFD